jgi:tetratricopeptide (TPR) repeat protein
MKRTPWISALFAVAFTSLLCPMQKLHAQQPPEESSSKPAEPAPAPPPAAPSESPAKKNKDSATQSAPDQPTWDPLRAEKDLEVGQYYMRRGDYDAAIDRFNDAIEAKPGYAVPFKFLGEAQEKKKLKKQAIKSYTRYLELFPSAEDGDKIRKKIDKLWSEIGEKKKQL